MRKIHYFFDWGHQWPLWETGYSAREPADLKLSEALQEEMLILQRFWESYYIPETGWSLTPEREAEFLRKAAPVAVHLQQEIAEWGIVIFAM
jgi:hypothetical protein